MPAVAIITSAFVDGATLMARACGIPDYAFATVPHPISNAGDAQLEASAREAFDQAAPLLART